MHLASLLRLCRKPTLEKLLAGTVDSQGEVSLCPLRAAEQLSARQGEDRSFFAVTAVQAFVAGGGQSVGF